MLEIISKGGLSLGPFQFELEVAHTLGRGVLRAFTHERGFERRFAFACRTAWTAQAVEMLTEELRHNSKSLLPLVILPFLSEEQLLELQARRVSGLDLCGNGLLYDPPKLFVLRTGAKKKFKISSATPSVYQSRNVATLVARVFLTQPVYPTAKAVLEACRARVLPIEAEPLPLVLPTVSKALAQLVQDLVVTRQQRELRLRDPERLLTNLSRSFRPVDPQGQTRFLGKTRLTDEAVRTRLRGLRPHVRAVVTGSGSARWYIGLAGPERLQLYVSNVARVVEALEARQTEAFPNLELIETQEEGVYFDARSHEGILWASPVQTFLELSEGTPREIDMAPELRARILRDIPDSRA